MAAGLIMVEPSGRFLLLRRAGMLVGGGKWNLPGGHIDEGETPLQGAQRELREETGYAAGELRALGDFWTVPGFASERMFAFLATDLREDPLEPDEDEDLSLECMPFADAIALARAGGLPDAKTIAALFMAEPHMGGGVSSG